MREDRGEEREQTKCEMVVDLVQMTFQEGFLAEEATYKAVVLILKGGGE